MKNKDKRITLTNEEMRVNFKKLQEDVKKIYGTMNKILPEIMIEKEIKPFGNASHIVLSKEYKGKKARVIIKK